MHAPHEGSTSLAPRARRCPRSPFRRRSRECAGSRTGCRAAPRRRPSVLASSARPSTAAYMSMSAFLPPVHEPPYAMSIFTDRNGVSVEGHAVARVARRRDHRPRSGSDRSRRWPRTVHPGPARTMHRSAPRRDRGPASRRGSSTTTSSASMMPVKLPASTAMFVRVARSSRDRPATPSPLNSSTWPMPFPLLKCSRDRMWSITSLAHTPGPSSPVKHEAHRLRHPHPHVAGEPGVRHVGAADAEREAAERAGHAGVRVGPRHDLPGQRELLDHLVVTDGFAAHGLAVARRPRRTA